MNSDLSILEYVVRTCLPRLADSTIDVHVQVQEAVMSLFLVMDRVTFLEDFEDDSQVSCSSRRIVNRQRIATETMAPIRITTFQRTTGTAHDTAAVTANETKNQANDEPNNAKRDRKRQEGIDACPRLCQLFSTPVEPDRPGQPKERSKRFKRARKRERPNCARDVPNSHTPGVVMPNKFCRYGRLVAMIRR